MREGIARINHPVLNTPLGGPWPEPYEVMILGMGCFWGAERIFWKLPGVINTSVGYAAGTTAWPSYEEVCTGQTGHAEVVRVVYDPREIDAEHVLKTFWENHDPTQGNRQGNDIGTQYRSLIAVFDEAAAQAARRTYDAFSDVLLLNGKGLITTQVMLIEKAKEASEVAKNPWEDPFFYLAERYHQQYLFHNPGGYCMHGPNGMTCPVGLSF